MSKSMILSGLATVISTLAISATPSYASFTGGTGVAKTITAVGGEADFFAKQIVCKKSTATGQIGVVQGLPKIEQNITYAECKLGAANLNNFTSIVQTVYQNVARTSGTVSFRLTEMEVTGGLGCKIKIPMVAGNLLLPNVDYNNLGNNELQAYVKANNLKYETNGVECGGLGAAGMGEYETIETIKPAQLAAVIGRAGKEEFFEPFLAVYGNPGANSHAEPTERPDGQGLGRNFSFGENMMFQASTGEVGENLKFELNEAEIKGEVKDSLIGATLLSNDTAENDPLGLAIQFADFQDSLLTNPETKKMELTPIYADTFDQPWLTAVCAPEIEKCNLDPLFTVSENEPNVKIEGVSIDTNSGLALQGTLWGKWENGLEKSPPCVAFMLPPAKATASQTLIVTHSPNTAIVKLGNLKTISGKACLISANNNWYSASEKTEPEITI